MADDGTRWRVERNIPVAAIATAALFFAGQAITGAVYISRLDTRIEIVEKALVVAAPQGERLTRVETKIDLALDNLREVQHTLNSTRIGPQK